MKKFMLLSLFIPFFAAQAQGSPQENIFGSLPGINSIKLQVPSGGCTTKSDFVFEVQDEGDRKIITFYRTRPDYCRAFFPVGKTLTFSFEEMGLQSGDRFKVGNPVIDTVVW